MDYKKYFIGTLSAIIIILIVIITTVIVIDPYQQYRYNKGYISNQRLENPGIARWHDYDAVITGSSMAMNHYPEQIDSLFGWKTINLTLMANTGNDYKNLFQIISETGKAKNIIMTLDYFSFVMTPIHLDLYLYDDNIMNDYEYWLNYTTVKNCIKKLSSSARNLTMAKLYHFNSPTGKDILDAAYQKAKTKYFKGEDFDFAKMKQCFDDTTLPIFSKDTSITYYIYYPPYSIYEFILMKDYGYFDDILKFKQYATDTLLTLHNVKLYDFQCEPSYICNTDEYMDLRHHSHKFNRRIIENIYQDSCRVNNENSKLKLERLKNLILNYN